MGDPATFFGRIADRLVRPEVEDPRGLRGLALKGLRVLVLALHEFQKNLCWEQAGSR